MFLFCSVSLSFQEERSSFSFFTPSTHSLHDYRERHSQCIVCDRIWCSPRTVRGSGVKCVFLVPAVTCCPGLPWFYCAVGSRYRPSRRSQGETSADRHVSASVFPGAPSAELMRRVAAVPAAVAVGFLPGAPPKRQHRPTAGTSTCGLGSRGLTFRLDVPHASAFTLAVLFFHL